MHVLDPREVDFDFQSSAVFKDMETGQELPTHPLQLRNSYQKAVQDFCADIKKGCRALNVDYIRITTNKPFDVALREYIVKRAKRI